MQSLRVLALLLGLGFASAACTKSNNDHALKGGSSKVDPNLLVFEAELILPKGMEKKTAPSDMLIWTLRDQNSEVVAAMIGPAPQFPHKLRVEGRQLLRPLTEKDTLFFNARIVKAGNEGKPPQKGELQIAAGAPEPTQQVVENPHVDKKRLEAFMKKMNLPMVETLRLGGKLKAEFSPVNL